MEPTLEDVARRLGEVERRLEAVEQALRTAPVPPAPAAPPRAAELRPPSGVSLSLIGRTLLILAGAFLLRALTEAGVLPERVGTLSGMGYAVLWIALADAAARRGCRLAAAYHGLAAALIAFPLLWEATVRFQVLSSRASAASLAIVTTLALAVASRWRLVQLVWLFTAGAALTGFALTIATRRLVLFGWFLLFLGVGTLWLGYARGWRGPGWLAAVHGCGSVALMAVAIVVGRTDRVLEILDPAEVVGLQLAFVAAYLGSIAIRTLASEGDTSVAEIALGTAVLAIGLGGALAVTRRTGLASLPVGLTSLLLGAGCYAVSFAFNDRRAGRRNFIVYTTAALVFTLVAAVELVGGSAPALALSAAALGVAWLGAVRSRATLSLHGAVYTLGAALASGLLPRALRSMVGTGLVTDRVASGAGLVVLAVAAACGWLPVATHGRTWGRFSRAPKLVFLVILALGVDGTMVVLLGRRLGVAEDPAAVAVVRTGVLAVSAVGLAALGRWRRFLEARWLVYPVLIAGGLKLLLEDVRGGRPATLFASLALYGSALIVAPRTIRRPTAPGTPPTAEAA
jgi:hypothetical protein